MSDMQNDLITTIDRICAAYCERPVRAAAEAGEWPAALWHALDEVGLVRAALPEAAGGPGLEFGDAMLALRRTAYHAIPVPLAETMLAGRLLVAAGLEVPDGPLTIAPVAQGDWLEIARNTSGSTVSGTARRVPWGNQCPYVAVTADFEGQAMVGLVSTKGLATGVEKNLAGEPRALLEFRNTPLIVFAASDAASQRLEVEGALYRSVQMTGALEAVFCFWICSRSEVRYERPVPSR